MDIHQATQHRWQYILPHIGIEPRYLRNTHQPCPICGGKDRFRFDDKDGMGTYFCNQCGAGNGFTLMMKHLHCSFREAAQIAADILGERQPTLPSPNAPETEPQKQPAPWRTAGRTRETGQRDNADSVGCGNCAVYAAVPGAGGRMRRYRNESEIGH